ncbi:MAG: flippase-like domain-containing protein [Chloroflexi bacterium]|nr:flippase-like domain-containing protein [Chloroflexota bacterium]
MVIGAFCGAVAIALLLSFADIRKVAQAFQSFPPVLLPVMCGLVLAREFIRVGEWHYLLHALHFRPKWRHSMLALVGGDASQILPAGVYFQNYLLQQTEGTSFATSLPATLGMQLLEAAVALVVVCVIGVPGWGWLRPVALIVMAGYAAFLVLVSRPAVAAWLERRANQRYGGWLMAQLGRFLEGLELLLTPGVILKAALLTAAYLAFTVALFYVVLQAYGLPNINLTAAAAIYCFVLTLVILVPLPSDLGLSEGGGVTVLLAFGVPLAQGVTIMLISRFATLFFTEVLAGVCLALYRGELQQMLRAGEA